jgi:PAS domain S-box-containing protein
MEREEKVDILLVDDNEGKLLALENILSSLDQNLLKAHSGKEALRALLNQDFAVVLLDVRMPGMDGFETAAMMREREKSAHLPIIFVTAADRSETHMARGYSLGAVDYIYTPIVPEILRAKVAVFVELKLQRERMRRIEQREHERQLGEAQDRLEVERQHFFTVSMDLLCIAGLDGYFRQLNPSWERTLGYATAELKSQSFLEFVHPDDREAALDALRKLDAGELVIGLENRYRARDGSYRWLVWNLTPHVKERLIYAVAHDVTERKQAELTLQVSNQELEAFSYSVSHDLRAPLRAIDGFSQMIAQDCGERLDDTGRRHLERIRNAVRRMGLLIDGLLFLARVSRTKLCIEEMDLSALARSVARELQERDPQRQVELVIAEGVAARGDATLVRVVLENLLDNAWKFTGERADAHIEFGFEANSGGPPVYSVCDNGEGFDMKYAGDLFAPFHRLHSEAKFPGMGIGLATVERVVRRHGGRVWAESVVSGGTVIRFTLGGLGQNRSQNGPVGGGVPSACAGSPGGEARPAMEEAALNAKTKEGQL